MASYGYPATAANETGNEKWVINKVNAKSGSGKLFVTLPKGAEWDMTIYAAGGTKVLSLELFNKTYWAQDAMLVAKTGLQKMKSLVNEITG